MNELNEESTDLDKEHTMLKQYEIVGKLYKENKKEQRNQAGKLEEKIKYTLPHCCHFFLIIILFATTSYILTKTQDPTQGYWNSEFHRTILLKDF